MEHGFPVEVTNIAKRDRMQYQQERAISAWKGVVFIFMCADLTGIMVLERLPITNLNFKKNYAKKGAFC